MKLFFAARWYQRVRRASAVVLCSFLTAASADVKIDAYSFEHDVASRSFAVTANGCEIPVAEVPAMDAAERNRMAEAYLKLPSYCHIYDPACMQLHAAHLAGNGDIDLLITVAEEINDFDVYSIVAPSRALKSGKVLKLAVKGKQEPRYFIIRIDQLPPLVVAIDRLETLDKHSSSVIDASRYLTDASGRSDQTPGLQKAFEAANGTGRMLYIPRGTFRIDQLHIINGHNFSIYLAPGCLLKVRPSEQGENQHRHGLWLQDCRNLTIWGPGGIDHQAYEHYAIYHNNYQDGMVDYYTSNEGCPWITQSPLFITGSQNIVVDGLVIRNGRNFNINVRNSDHITLRRIKILTPPASTPEYADGINTSSCRHVLVENCLVACNDDCFASGHYFAAWDHRSAENHVVRGMLGWNMRANAVRLGFYAAFDQGDFTFENCCFVAMPFGSVLIHALHPHGDGVPARYGTIRLSNCTFATAEKLKVLFSVEKASITNLELKKVRFAGGLQDRARFMVEGDPDAPIDRVELDHVFLNGKKIDKENLLLQLKNIRRIEIK